MSHAPFDNARERLLLPFMGGFYDSFAQPFAWTALRLAVGLTLAVEGWPKIIAPLAQAGFLEGLGFYPGWFWSPFLALLQIVGGLLIAVGLFTRPAALASGIMLAITLWFHITHPYGHAFLTAEGINALAAGGDYLTPEGLARLSDGGTAFLESVQTKAEQNSLFWTGSTFLYAAFGGGYWSIDRWLLKRVF